MILCFLINLSAQIEILPSGSLPIILDSDTVPGTPFYVKVKIREIVPDTYKIGIWVYGGAGDICEWWDPWLSSWRGWYHTSPAFTTEKESLTFIIPVRIKKFPEAGYDYYIKFKIEQISEGVEATSQIYDYEGFNLMNMRTEGGWICGKTSKSGYYVLVKRNDTVFGFVRAEDNGVDEGNPSLSGYFICAVPAGNYDEIEVRDTNFNIFSESFDIPPPYSVSAGDTTFVSFFVNVDSLKVSPQNPIPYMPCTLKIFVKNPFEAEVTLKIRIFEDTTWDYKEDVFLDSSSHKIFALSDTILSCILKLQQGNRILIIYADNTRFKKCIKVGNPIGEIVINEFLPYTSDYNEFIEILNRWNKPINLKGWWIGKDEPDFQIKDSIVLNPGQFAVLCSDRADFRKYQIPQTAIIIEFDDWAESYLPQAGEIRIYMPDSFEIDYVRYTIDLGSHYDTSVERINPEIPSLDSTNWGLCVHPLGATPGDTNSIYAGFKVKELKLEIEPKVFNPEDPTKSRIFISYKLPFVRAYVRLFIFDVRGRVVRKLCDGTPSGARSIYLEDGSVIYSHIWDGKDDKGRNLPMGPYIIYLQAQDMDSKKVVSARKTCIVIRK